MQAFPPMDTYASAFVHRVARIYGLKSSQQGSGRKRFVMVAATAHTRLPSEPGERERLAALLAGQEEANAALRPGSRPGSAARGEA